MGCMQLLSIIDKCCHENGKEEADFFCYDKYSKK